MPPEEQQATTMREDFDAAISAIENDEEGAITVQTEEESRLNAGDDDTNEASKKAEAKATVEAEAKKVLGEKPDDEAGTGSDGIKAEDIGIGEENKDADAKGNGESTGNGLDTAPASWSPENREGWKDIPEPVRVQINKRETEINKALMDGSEHRKTGEKFTALTDQYAQVIAAEGATDALTGVSELMKTVAVLRMGSPEQKAQKIAGFIKHYGIPIEMLDGILAGQIGAPQPAPDDAKIDPNLESILDARLKPVNDLLARMDENTRKQNFDANQKAIDEVVAFKADPAHEFYADVQDVMADFVDVARKNDVVMPLQEAYDKACAMNQQVNDVLTKRAATAKLLNGKESLEAKKIAASSIMGQQGGDPVTDGEGQSMRQVITDAWDSQTG